MLRLAAVATLALMFALSACGGDDDGPAPTLGTPVGTKDFTPTPSLDATQDPGGGVAPEPVEPTLDDELTEVTRGNIEATVGPGETFGIDPEEIANASVGAPPCENFLFDFSWQVTDPYPPDGVDLVWLFNRAGSDVQVASGPAGEQGVGCGALAIANNGTAPITVAIKYAIGGLP